MKYVKRVINKIKEMANMSDTKKDQKFELPSVEELTAPIEQAIEMTRDITKNVGILTEQAKQHKAYIFQLEEDNKWNRTYSTLLLERVLELTAAIQELPNILGEHMDDDMVDNWMSKMEHSTDDFIKKYDELVGALNETIH